MQTPPYRPNGMGSTDCEHVGVAGEVERPAVVVGDAVAHTFPAGAVTFEVAVLELDAGAVGGLGDEADLDLAGWSGRSRAASTG